jgi:hypothetical protein
MKLTALATISSLTLLTANASILNFPKGSAPLNKRSGETVYLSNCYVIDGGDNYSQIDVSQPINPPYPPTNTDKSSITPTVPILRTDNIPATPVRSPPTAI